MSVFPAPVVQPARRPGLLAFARQHPLVSYFVLTYLITWTGWLPVILGQNGLGYFPWHLPFVALVGGGIGPIASALLLTLVTSGKVGLVRFLRRFITWRVGLQWYAFVVLGIPALLFAGMFLFEPGAATAFRLSTLPSFLLSYASLLPLQMVQSPLVEEPGWRGFALPRLQETVGPLRGTLVLGAFWGCWHFPLFLMPGYNGSGTGILGVGIPFGEFVIACLGLSVIITWVFNHTRGSLLVAVLFHAVNDSVPLALLFPVGSVGAAISAAWPTVVGTPCFLILGLVLVIATGGRMGYRKVEVEQVRAAHMNPSEVTNQCVAGALAT